MANVESTTVRGECFVSFAFDVGSSTNLQRCQEILGGGAEWKHVTRSLRRSPSYLTGWPGSLCVHRELEEIAIAGFPLSREVNVTLFDFGAISVSFTLPLNAELTKLAALSEALYENERLLDRARRIVAEILEKIRSAVTSANIAQTFEDYAVYWFREVGSSPLFSRENREVLASILRSEKDTLSSQEVDDALSQVLTYTPEEMAAIDWNSSIVVGKDMADVVSLLEFANIELLELAYLDSRLREFSNRAYELLQTRKITTDDLNLVRRFQIDAVDLLADINNPLRLFGDHFLARVHRSVATRFDLSAWITSIENRLERLSVVAMQMSDHRRDERSHRIEVVIAVLIVIDILLWFAK